MAFTRKPSEPNGLLGLKQSSQYGEWAKPNVSYGTVPASRETISGPKQEEVTITKQSLLGTMIFLFILLLVGFIAGYSLRGSAYASANNNGVVSLAMTSIQAPQSLAADGSRSKLIANFGSEAPDELLAFEAVSEDDLSALVRLHSSGAGDSDRISLMNIAGDGSMIELLRQDAAGVRAIDMSRLPDGAFVTATLYPSVMEMRGITPDGETLWSRDILTAENHKAPVKVVAMPFATAIVGPSESSNRISLTYLSNKGELIWQRSFPADVEEPDLRLVPNRDGSIFLIMRNPADIGRGTHSLVRIDREGQDVWRSSLDLDDVVSKIELSSSGDGGAHLLVAGDIPVVTKFGQFGDALWSSPLPQAKFFSNIHLVTTSEGNSVTVVSYSIADQRLDVLLEERNKHGEVIGESSLTLPGSSSIDAVMEASPGHYFMAGSMQTDRFGDADIFVEDIAFQPASSPHRQMSAELDNAVLSPVISQALQDSAVVDQLDTLGMGDTIVLSSLPESPASSISNQIEQPSRAQDAGTVEQAVATIEVEQRAMQADRAPEVADDGVALSRFISYTDDGLNTRVVEQPNVRAQCRFSCLEENNASAVFPMWRAIEAPQSSFNAGLPDVHDLTCRAAGGAIDLNTTPDCQPY